MSEMVDQAASALYADWVEESSFPGVIGYVSWDLLPDKETWRRRARAAIEAMRPPTPQMAQALARRAWHSGSGIRPETVWHAAIDAALAPSQPESPNNG